MKSVEHDLNFRDLFIPLTQRKAIIFIIIIGLAVYFTALFNGFVWDDTLYVLGGSEKIGLNFYKLFTGDSIFNTTGFYRPVTALYYYILYSLFGIQPFFYHLFQISIHIGICIIFFLFLKRFFSKSIALVLSLIFLVHPMQAESVAYIASYGFLSFLFGIIALYFSDSKNPTLKSSTLTFVILLLSLLSKETGIVFVVLLPVYRYLIKKSYVLNYCIICFVSLLAYICFRFLSGGLFVNNVNSVPIAQLSFFTRLLNIPEIVFYYLKTFIYPVNLAIGQSWVISRITFGSFYLPLLIDSLFISLLIFVGTFVLKNKYSGNAFLFFTIWFILGMSLNLQIIPLDGTVADRWFYLPMAGLLGLTGVIWQSTLSKKVMLSKRIYILSIIIILLFSLRTIVRNLDWKDPITLYSHDVNIVDSYNTEALLGNELWHEGNIDQALIHYEKSADLRPGYDYIASEIAGIYERKGDLKLAKIYNLKAINLRNYATDKTHSYITYLTIGRFLLYYDSPILADKFLKQGLAEYPKEKYLWILLGLTEYKLNNKQAALTAFKQANNISPDKNVLYLYSQVSAGKPVNIPVQSFWPK